MRSAHIKALKGWKIQKEAKLVLLTFNKTLFLRIIGLTTPTIAYNLFFLIVFIEWIKNDGALMETGKVKSFFSFPF